MLIELSKCKLFLMRLNKNTYNLINGNIITLNNIVPVANSITINNGKIESINSPNNSYKSIDLKQFKTKHIATWIS